MEVLDLRKSYEKGLDIYDHSFSNYCIGKYDACTWYLVRREIGKLKAFSLKNIFCLTFSCDFVQRQSIVVNPSISTYLTLSEGQNTSYTDDRE